jgi:hypothetical protein
MIDVHSFTGDEQGMAELMVELYRAAGLRVQWQQVEEGRANVLGTLAGSGGGKSLMFNGHMDTSYSGREPWLKDVPGFQPHAFERDGRLYGLGISNMKGALACYVEAVRAVQEAGVRLRGDVLVAASAARSRRRSTAPHRGRSSAATPPVRAIWSRTAASPTCACSVSRPRARSSSVTSARCGCGSACTATSSTRRSARASATRRGAADGRAARADPAWCERWSADERTLPRRPAIASVGAVRGGFEWRSRGRRSDERLSSTCACRRPADGDARRAVLGPCAGARGAHPDWEIDARSTSPRRAPRSTRAHELVGGDRRAHQAVFGEAPGRDVPRWFSDASALTATGSRP